MAATGSASVSTGECWILLDTLAVPKPRNSLPIQGSRAVHCFPTPTLLSALLFWRSPVTEARARESHAKEAVGLGCFYWGFFVMSSLVQNHSSSTYVGLYLTGFKAAPALSQPRGVVLPMPCLLSPWLSPSSSSSQAPLCWSDSSARQQELMLSEWNST